MVFRDKPIDFQVVRRLFYKRTVNLLSSERIAQSQSVETEVVDISRDALTPGRNHRLGLRRKQLAAFVAGHSQSVIDVPLGLRSIESTEPAQDGDALA